MITRKELAVMYNCDYRKISLLLDEFGIITPRKGKGRRSMLTPREYEAFRLKIGEPFKR